MKVSRLLGRQNNRSQRTHWGYSLVIYFTNANLAKVNIRDVHALMQYLQVSNSHVKVSRLWLYRGDKRYRYDSIKTDRAQNKGEDNKDYTYTKLPYISYL